MALHGTNVVEAVERGPCVALLASAEVSASELHALEREREDDGVRAHDARRARVSSRRDEKRSFVHLIGQFYRRHRSSAAVDWTPSRRGSGRRSPKVQRQ